mgnify:CR=1 FL=1
METRRKRSEEEKRRDAILTSRSCFMNWSISGVTTYTPKKKEEKNKIHSTTTMQLQRGNYRSGRDEMR